MDLDFGKHILHTVFFRQLVNMQYSTIQTYLKTYFFFSCEWCLNSYIFFYKCCLYSFYKVNHGHSVANSTDSAVSEHHFHTWKGTCIAETSQQTFRAEAFKKSEHKSNISYWFTQVWLFVKKKKKVTSMKGWHVNNTWETFLFSP